MKILIVCCLYPPDIVGGAEKSVGLLAESFVASGHETVVVCLTKDGEDRIEYLNGVKVHRLKMRNIYWPYGPVRPHPIKRALWHLIDIFNFRVAAKLGEILREERPDIMQTHNLAGLSPAVWWTAHKHGVPINHVIHDYALLCPKTTMFKNGDNCQTQCATCRFFTFHKRRMSNLVDGVIGVSGFTLNRHLCAGYFAKTNNAQVINNIADAIAQDDAPSPERVEKVLFGFLGQVTENKGIETLIKSLLNAPQNNWELLIAGRVEEAYLQRLKRAYPDPRIRFLGFTSSDAFFREINLLVVPSLWEDPFPRVLTEALIHRKMVLASQRGGIPEIVVPNSTGWLFDSPSELGRIIESLLKGELSFRVNEEERGKIMHRLSKQVTLTQYINVLTDLSKKPGAAP